MAVTPTPNKALNLVTVGTEPGTWGPYVNANQTLLDTMLGGVTTVALLNTPVTLSAGQYQNVIIKLTGALTGNVAVTFPGGVGGFWTVLNQTTNSSIFSITLNTTAAGTNTIGLPPGQNTKILVDGVSPQFGQLPHNVGGYWDHAGSSVPAWVSNCTVPPYLNCDGSAFNAATYPALNAYLGGNTLPDTRGRFRAVLNQGTGRMTSGNGGVDGNTILASGGADTVTLLSSAMPTHTHTANVTDPGHFHGLTISSSFNRGAASGAAAIDPTGASGGNKTDSKVTGITVANVNTGGGGAHSIMAPTYVGGITMVRAA